MEKWGCLFDIDGVIVDSESQYTVFWNSIEEIYPTGAPNYAVFIKGSNLPTILNTYYPDQAVQADIQRRLDDFESNMPYDIFPGVIEFLQELQAAGVPCAVVTSSLTSKMERLYQYHPELRQYFAAAVYGDMVTSPKPSPECYIKGAAAIGLDNAHCIVFEDSLNGLKAGNAAGSTTVALSTTLPCEELKKLEPDMIIPSFVGFHIPSLLPLLQR